MTHSPTHPHEPASDAARQLVGRTEPKASRTFTPTQAVIARSAGVYHWTPDGKRLFDFTSGVLVANLGHNPVGWLKRFAGYMGWPAGGPVTLFPDCPPGYLPAVPLTAYNAVTPLEADATARLLAFVRSFPGGGRLDRVMWAASGSEAVHKALYAGIRRDPARPMIVATRHGFHGKKGLANAVTGSEHDADRDPRVQFVSFPKVECDDHSRRNDPFDPESYERELAALHRRFGRQLGTLISEPYLGGGGSYHPPPAYLHLLQRFCREHDIMFVLDEVQSNFGRTGRVFAYDRYGLEPDVVILGKGLGNGVPVAAAVGRADVFDPLGYGEASDTWSGNPLSAAAVLATLDEFETHDIIDRMQPSSAALERGLVELKRYPFVARVRGEAGGMVWGVETADHAGRTANEWANALVLAAYRGDGATADGVHLLGPLAGKVVRVSPPLVISVAEVEVALRLLHRACETFLNT